MRIYLETDGWFSAIGMLFDAAEGHSTDLGVSVYKIFDNRLDHNPTWSITRVAGLENDIINLWIGLEQG